jgi:hypothetical protein
MILEFKKSHRDGSYCSGGFQSAVNAQYKIFSAVGTAHVVYYMRRPDGTHKKNSGHLRRIEIRRYNMSRPDGTFSFNRTSR